MKNRISAPEIRNELLKRVSVLPSAIKVYRNILTKNYEVWLRGVYVMDFKKVSGVEIRKLKYRFSQHNSERDNEMEIRNFEEYRKKSADQFESDMINEMASDVDKYSNKNAYSVSVLPKR